MYIIMSITFDTHVHTGILKRRIWLQSAYF